MAAQPAVSVGSIVGIRARPSARMRIQRTAALSSENRIAKAARPKAKGQRQHGDLCSDNDIIRVAQEAIGTAADEGCAGKYDDPCRPTAPERGDHPDPEQLQDGEDSQPRQADWAIPGQDP